MRMHCIYCGMTIPVQAITYRQADVDEKARRLVFENVHDRLCGPKAVGIILDLEEGRDAAL